MSVHTLSRVQTHACVCVFVCAHVCVERERGIYVQRCVCVVGFRRSPLLLVKAKSTVEGMTHVTCAAGGGEVCVCVVCVSGVWKCYVCVHVWLCVMMCGCGRVCWVGGYQEVRVMPRPPVSQSETTGRQPDDRCDAWPRRHHPK